MSIAACSPPWPLMTMFAVVEPAATWSPAERLTEWTTPAWGLSSLAWSRFCWTDCAAAVAASMVAWSAASCWALGACGVLVVPDPLPDDAPVGLAAELVVVPVLLVWVPLAVLARVALARAALSADSSADTVC